MRRRPECQRQCLIEGALAKVEQCSCGMIHVTAGPLTVRLDPQAFESIASTFAAGADRLRKRASSMLPS